MGRPPFVKGFKPFGIRGETSATVVLLYEEYEAIRLSDYEGLSQEVAASKMDVSRPTYTRIYESARRKIAKSLAEYTIIMIEGGNVAFDDNWYECLQCSSTFRKPTDQKITRCVVCGSDRINLISTQQTSDKQKYGKRQRMGQGHGGYCVCPGCGKKEPHMQGVPCRTTTCDNCGVSLVRENSEHHKIVLENKKKQKSMKIAIATVEKDINSEMDERFGRGAYFAIINARTWEAEFLENPSKDSQSGAGVKAVEFIISKGIDKIIAKEFGPKVKNLLEKAGIDYVETGRLSGTMMDIVKKFA